MDATGNLWHSFIEYLFQSGAISVPDNYHDRCDVISVMMDNEVTGLVSTVTNYAINSAKEAEFSIECSDQTTEDLLNLWLSEVNLKLNGIPTGIKELAAEYYKERWTGSSFCLMRVSAWKKYTIGKNSIEAPTALYFVNGGSIWVDRPNPAMYKLGTDKYYLDKEHKTELPNSAKDESIVVQKPFARWQDKYPSPYLIKTGVYKNWKAFEVLQSKSDDLISKFIPYLFQIKKGSAEGIKEGISYDDKDMKLMLDSFKEQAEQYRKERAKLPVSATPFDQEYSHLMPDLTKMLNENLYNQGSRAILCGLGFIDVIQGISSTRKESVLNPKPFIAEINSGVSGFKSILMEVIRAIVNKNGEEHKKLFSGKKPLRVVNSPIKINVEGLIDSLRSAFVYGSITIETYQEILGVDPEQEYERMVKEWEVDERTGLNRRELFYAHIIQNTEDKGIDVTLPQSGDKSSIPLKKPTVPTTKKQIEKQNEKTKGTEESEQILNDPLDPNLDTETAPYTETKYPKYLDKYPAGARTAWISTWNSVYKESGDEAKAFKVAWTVLHKWMKRHGGKNKGTQD